MASLLEDTVDVDDDDEFLDLTLDRVARPFADFARDHPNEEDVGRGLALPPLPL